MILGPVAQMLEHYSRLAIVGDTALNYIPFASLPLPHSEAGRPLLIAKHEIVHLPSASVLALLRQVRANQRNQLGTVAVVADPVFEASDPRVRPGTPPESSGEQTTPCPASRLDHFTGLVAHTSRASEELTDLSRLFHSRAEADAIAAVFPPGTVCELLDFDANRTRVMSSDVLHSRIIHFATHGLLDAKNPELSGLVFSLVDRNGQPQVGFWGLEDIFNLSLRADLVVLSACQTALGEEVDGEGLVGLTWGFLYAGAKTVVASLWKVDDASTAELMRLFYDAIERQGMKPAAALRSAQWTMSQQRQWADPYYWAGFVIEGDWTAAPYITVKSPAATRYHQEKPTTQAVKP